MSNTDSELVTDLLVIGAGPGGYTAAIRGAQRGLDVLLVERETVGGVCINHGCIPAKSLIHAAGFQRDIQHWNEIGIETGEVSVDFDAIQAWKNDVIERLTANIRAGLDDHDVRLLGGTASFRDSSTVVVEGQRDDRIVEFDHAVVATGSEPLELPGLGFDNDRVISSREVLQLDEVPDELVVVGGGYIGMEAVTKFAKFGASVRVVEARDRVLMMFEEEIVDTIQETSEMYTDGIYTNALATGLEYDDDGRPVLVVDHDGTERRFTADYVIVAAGRDTTAARDRLALENTDVELTEKGYIERGRGGRGQRVRGPRGTRRRAGRPGPDVLVGSGPLGEQAGGVREGRRGPRRRTVGRTGRRRPCLRHHRRGHPRAGTRRHCRRPPGDGPRPSDFPRGPGGCRRRRRRGVHPLALAPSLLPPARDCRPADCSLLAAC